MKNKTEWARPERAHNLNDGGGQGKREETKKVQNNEEPKEETRKRHRVRIRREEGKGKCERRE